MSALAGDPLWYKDAVIYELHIRSFYDSDGDGIGDFQGLTEKLDYLQELGVTALWVLPFYPSPLRDDGYDIADYRSVNPAYGTMDEFRTFLEEAHRRDLRVITELVINHTSDQHPWFQRARRAPPGSEERDYYVWSDDPEKYRETRVIFQDFEPSNWTFDDVAGQYFWHRFYHHQPDLNFDNPRVHQEIFDALDYWLEMGVDGMRLDAIPYLYEREGTNCENLPETHAFLKELRAHVDARFDDRLFLAEANQWPEDAAAYFGDGDECHMNFHFPIMPRLFMALRMEDRFPIIDILEQTPEIPDPCQWAIFLRNHDELTLEMVTDEERDYMYRVYAHDMKARINLGIRRRLAPLLENNRRKIELMKSLLFALPGTPVLYYGDEIGMGDNFYLGDRNGVRTPMQWSGDRNAGFSRANPQKLFLPVIIDPEYHYESVNVEAQEGNPSSLLWWTRRLIALRKQHQAFGRGSLEWVSPENKRVLAFVREHEDEAILVVANLSRFSQAVELDLSDHAGTVPVELFGRTPFPPVRPDEPYRLTLGPHNFYWFLLETEATRRERIEVTTERPSREALPSFRAEERWSEVLEERSLPRLERALVEWLPTRRWFAGKGRGIRKGEVVDVLPVAHGDGGAPTRGSPAAPREAPRPAGGAPPHVLLLRVEYVADDPETYVVPLDWSAGETAEGLWREQSGQVLARMTVGEEEGVLHDALAGGALAGSLLEAVAREGKRPGRRGRLHGVAELPTAEILGPSGSEPPAPVAGRAEQSNTSVIYADRWILKLLRRLEWGPSLDREVGRFLTARGFEHTPAVAGALEYRVSRDQTATLGVLQEFVPNQGDAWSHALDSLQRYFERARAAGIPEDGIPFPEDGGAEGHGVGEEGSGAGHEDDPANEVPELVHDLVGEPYLEAARLLGRRTAELHRALASGTDHADFAPEAFTTLYQRSVYQSMRNLLGQTLRTVRARVDDLDEESRADARTLLERRDELIGRFRRIVERKLEAGRIRVHGDYHLGQLLYTGKDFVVIDFEGEPSRPLGERRLKRSPLRDVAGMLRSFDYAAHSVFFEIRDEGLTETAEAEMREWVRFWTAWVSHLFLLGYEAAMEGEGLLPTEARDRELLLESHLLEKALYELDYELTNRPRWVRIPLEGILRLLDGRPRGD